MTTTTSTVTPSSPIAATVKAMRARVRVGDLVSFAYLRGKVAVRATFRVDTVAPHTVAGIRVAKNGATIFRNGGPLQASAPFWHLVDVRPGPQTWADAKAENEERSAR